MGSCTDRFPYKVADAKIYDLNNCQNVMEKTITCNGPSTPTEMYTNSGDWAGVVCSPYFITDSNKTGFRLRTNPADECVHMIGEDFAIIPDCMQR
jgi:hypothetical protein